MVGQLLSLMLAALLLAGCSSKPPPPAFSLATQRERPGLEVYAVEYARSKDVAESQLVVGAAEDARFDMSWYFYVVVGDGQIALVDTGTDQLAKEGSKKRATWRIAQARTVVETLATVGLKPEDIDAAYLTHHHFDHADGIASLPRARVHAHADVWKSMRRPDRKQRHAAATVTDAGRAVEFTRTPHEVASNVRARVAGRHTPGHTVYAVTCGSGTQVLLSGDGAYLYANLDRKAPTTVNTSAMGNVADMEALVKKYGREAVVPGHDPRVFARFPNPAPGVARLCD